jgi:hypothetical protein
MIQNKWRNHFQEHKTLFTVLIVGLLFLELQIFALAAMKSGRQSRIHVMDQRNNVVYQTRSSHFDSWEQIQFEKTFGPLSDYRVRQVTVERPFPFRAWFAAAVGLPIGAMLLFGFFIRAYEALFFRNEAHPHATDPSRDSSADKFGNMMSRVSRMNIFAIGGFVLVFSLALFAIPHLIAEFGSYGASIISEYRWVVLGILAVLLGFVVWIVLLRYKLAHKAIETHAEVEKYRLQLEFNHRRGSGSIAQMTGPERRLQLSDPTHMDVPAADEKTDR